VHLVGFITEKADVNENSFV